MDEFSPPQKQSSSMGIGLAFIGLIAVVVLLAIPAGTRGIAIAVGVFVPSGIGVILGIVAMIDRMTKTSKAGDENFSSFPPNEERMFIGHERAMTANSSRASTVGFGIAGVVFAIGMLVTLTMYTPCTGFCERPPNTCKTDAQIAQWRASCESTCRNLESMAGLTITKQASETDKSMITVPATGTEYVTQLAGCSFSGGNGPACEEVVKRATTMGLWCPESN